ncbi:MAG: alcohol dehydrogenase catalytic domain-containing protein [Sphaerochaetaceae bacterium]
MLTQCVRLHKAYDARLESVELPGINEDEILVRIVTNTICMSDYKGLIQGEKHKRVPKSLSQKPVMMGHEICGTIIEVGQRWRSFYRPSMRFTVQPGLNPPGTCYATGYSFPFFGGYSEYAIVPAYLIEAGGLLVYEGEAFFEGSLAEPYSCVISTVHSLYHTRQFEYEHLMGPKAGGSVLVIGACGSMGLACLDYLAHGPYQIARIVACDINRKKLDRAASLLDDPRLLFTDSNRLDELLELNEAQGYDDVICMVAEPSIVELAQACLGGDGCLNFFAGPMERSFSARFNFYDVHYSSHHLIGTSGGGTADMIEAVDLISSRALNPFMLITHVGGLDCVTGSLKKLPALPGAKKLIYTHISLPLTSLEDLGSNPMLKEVDSIVRSNGMAWSAEAERALFRAFAQNEEA